MLFDIAKHLCLMGQGLIYQDFPICHACEKQNQTALVRELALPLTSCVAVGMSHQLSDLHLSHVMYSFLHSFVEVSYLVQAYYVAVSILMMRTQNLGFVL